MAYLKTTPVTVAITDTLISEARSRKYFGIQNPGANTLFVTFNGPEAGEDYQRASTALNGIKVAAGEFYDITTESGALSGEIRGIAVGGEVLAVINEG